MPPAPPARTGVEQRMEQLMINQKGNHRSGDTGRIEDGTDGNRVMNRVVVTETGPAWTRTPPDLSDLDLIVEIPVVQVPVDLFQGMVLSRRAGDHFSPSPEPPPVNGLFHEGLFTILLVKPGHRCRRPAPRDLAGQEVHDCFEHCPRSLTAVIAHSNNPRRAFAPDRMGQADVRIEGGLDFGLSKEVER